MEDHDKSKNDPSRPVEPQISIEAAAEPTAAADLPFLVTHWLANYNNNNQQQQSTIGSTPEERNAIQRIRRAASELSSAFHALGSFGTTTRPSLSTEINRTFGQASSAVVPATFGDRRRQWSHRCPPERLEHLLTSAATTEQVIGTPVGLTMDLIQSSLEARTQQIHQPRTGRTLQDAIDVSDTAVATEGTEGDDDNSQPAVHTSLGLPLILAKNKESDEKDDKKAPGILSLTSKFELAQKDSADATRRYIDLREEYNRLKQQIVGIHRSLSLQEKCLSDLEQDRARLSLQNGSLGALAKSAALEEIQESEQNANRVIAQLKRQLSLLEAKDSPLGENLHRAKEESVRKYQASQSLVVAYRDPYHAATSKRTLIQTLVHRSSGLNLVPLARNIHRSIHQQIEEVRKSVMIRRMSFAATINTHLAYPIYCLRFDRTGRYFITGADDYLSRVFCLGSHLRANPGSAIDPLTFQRGAVLVCTLRGHAGVINDIAVSSDNAFLATASEDGDCRVWGLRDGSPIAILRGHTGGANMVSWSTLTPYRLVTAGADGYARCWDIREACLIRYGGVVGKRFEYKRRKGEDASNGQREADRSAGSQASDVALPPIPARVAVVPVAAAAAIDETNAQAQEDSPVREAPLPLPPLPPGDSEVQAAQPAPPEAEQAEEAGRFVAGDEIDEGVRLLSKMQHGASLDERMGGHGTRSRRAAVKVLCVDVCPLGQHVATGADDGICRVFSSNDDVSLERLDSQKSNKEVSEDVVGALPLRQSRRQLVTGRLLLTLKGHLSAITDLKYSYAGDRLLSASQRDGVVRIWSWSGDNISANESSVSSPSSSAGGNPAHVNHILIKLTNPEKAASITATSRTNRQRPSRTAAATTISCDVAVWMKDDSKILTSQCELVKQTSSEIQPGSQFIFLWDSFTGQCLLGIHGAHTMQCPVVLPHPILPSVICSAGADGLVKVWCLDKGECVLEHKNTVDFGPVEAREKGMISGYLDGSFSPDGTEAVLTDDSGRVTVLDCINIENESYPGWMREQYFANDYYELCYDRHGYCIERGSEQPPHLAPRGVRCSHSGAPLSEHVNAAFKGVVGPLPEPEKIACWSRIRYRQLSRYPQKRILKRNLVSQFDPETTTMIGIEMIESKKDHVGIAAPEPPSAPRSPRLSSNWRWRDYTDILQEEGQAEEEEADPDDDSYELNDMSNRRTLEGDEDDESDLGDFEQESPVRRNRRSSPEAHSNRPARNRRRSSYDDLVDSDDDDELVEFMSSNNTPSGPFRADYDTHFFRLTTGIQSINRKWVHRIESSSSYAGRKGYVPQCGDTVVYIPRAHFDVIKDFPTLSPPWQNWPDGAEWPVVRCTIRSVRYRFPYKDSFSRNKSIVAILTLEVTGIPELSRDRDIPWPKPTFIDLPRRQLFDVSMFESNSSDFIIPIGLYTSRLADIENATLEHDGPVRVEAFYAELDDDDADLMPYEGTFLGWEEEVVDSGDANLYGSGYRSLLVGWADGGETDKLSPWEIALQDSSAVSDIERPRLSDAEKRQIRDALTHVRNMEDVEAYLFHQVNTDRYTDYESRVENPMWLDFVRIRLEADYYASRLSVIYDVKLIRDNSLKYNGEDDLTSKATKMYEKFSELVLSSKELAEFRDFETNLVENAVQASSHHEEAGNELAAMGTETGGVIRRSRRQTQNQSSLETLPAPGNRAGNGDRSVQARTRTFSTGQSRRRASEGSVSTLEVASVAQGRRTRASAAQEDTHAAQAAPLVPLNSRNRGRTTRNSRGQQPSGRQLRSTNESDLLSASRAEEDNSRARRGRAQRAASRGGSLSPSRRSGRLTAGHPSYAEPGEDGDIAESELEEMNLSARGRRRSVRSATRESFYEPHDNEPTRSRRRRTSLAVHDSDTEEPQSLLRSSRRLSRAQEESDEDSEAENQLLGSSRRIRIRVAPSQASPRNARNSASRTRSSSRRISSPRTDDSEQEDDSLVPQIAGRNTRRSKRRRSPSSDESGGSDVNPKDESSEESEAQGVDESDEEEEVVEPRRKKKRSSPTRRASRASVKTSYYVPSSSEFDESEDDESEDDSEAKPPAKKSRRSTTKSAKKKTKRDDAEIPARPTLTPWPEIGLKHITEVGEEVLRRLADLDEDDLFAIPVEEAVPDLAGEYNEKIIEPMDFRTIQEERMPSYRSIRELQADLVTVFHNCIVFNGASHQFGLLAHSLHSMLEDIFKSSCENLRVTLPADRPHRRR